MTFENFSDIYSNYSSKIAPKLLDSPLFIKVLRHAKIDKDKYTREPDVEAFTIGVTTGVNCDAIALPLKGEVPAEKGKNKINEKH